MPQQPDIVGAKLAEGQALEHRLTNIESAIAAGFREMSSAVKAVDDRVREQNSRIGKLEQWRQDVREAVARARGIAEGRANVTKAQLALLGFIATAAPAVVTAAVTVAFRIWAN